MSIKLVVFDIAGTTVKDNNNVSEAFQSALAKNEISVELEKINPLMGYEKKLAIARFSKIILRWTSLKFLRTSSI